MTALELLQAHQSPRVVLACILHAGNVDEIPELLSFVRERGLQVVFQPMIQEGRVIHRFLDFAFHGYCRESQRYEDFQLCDADQKHSE